MGKQSINDSRVVTVREAREIQAKHKNALVHYRPDGNLNHLAPDTDHAIVWMR